MENISALFKHYIDSQKYQGIEWIIQKNEKKYFGSLGYLNIENKIKLTENTIYRIWSMTKPIISIVILQMVEEKVLKFNDPINLFLPIFNNLRVLNENSNSITDIKQLKKMPTIKDLLLHTAGFSYNFLGDIIAEEYHKAELFYSEDTTLEQEINTLANIPLLYEPGSRWVYSVSVDVLARIIEVVSGTSLEVQLKKRIFEPLEMNNTSFSLSKKNQNKLMTSYHYDNSKKKLIKPDVNRRYISNYGYPINNVNFARGGIGLYSTAKDYLIFANMLQTGSSIDKKIIISSNLLNEACQNQVSSLFLPFEIKNFDIKKLEENLFESYGWGYGFRVLLNGKKYGNEGEFGWGGAASTFFLIDRKKCISAVLMTQVFQGDQNLQKDFYNFIYSHL